MSDWMNDLNEMQRYYPLRREVASTSWFARRLKDGKGDRRFIAGSFAGLDTSCPPSENLCKIVMEMRLLPKAGLSN